MIVIVDYGMGNSGSVLNMLKKIDVPAIISSSIEDIEKADKSYHVVCDEKYVLARTHYSYNFISAVGRDNIFGVQFHPEKSHKYGMKVFDNFYKLK